MGGGHLVYRFEACAATADGVLWSDPLHAAAGALSPSTVPSPTTKPYAHAPHTRARATHTHTRHATQTHAIGTHPTNSRSRVAPRSHLARSHSVCARCVRRAGAQPRAPTRFCGGEAPAARNELTLSAQVATHSATVELIVVVWRAWDIFIYSIYVKTPVGPDYPDIHFQYIDIIRKLEAVRRNRNLVLDGPLCAVQAWPWVSAFIYLSIYLKYVSALGTFQRFVELSPRRQTSAYRNNEHVWWRLFGIPGSLVSRIHICSRI